MIWAGVFVVCWIIEGLLFSMLGQLEPMLAFWISGLCALITAAVIWLIAKSGGHGTDSFAWLFIFNPFD